MVVSGSILYNDRDAKKYVLYSHFNVEGGEVCEVCRHCAVDTVLSADKPHKPTPVCRRLPELRPD